MGTRTGRRTIWSVCFAVLAGSLLWWGLDEGSTPLPPGISNEEFKQARAEYQDRYGEPADRDDALSWLAEARVADEQWDQALACFAAISTEHPRYGRSARYQEGQIALQQRQAVRAERCLREVIALEERDPTLPPEQLVDARRRLRFLLEIELRFEERAQLLKEMLARREAEPFEKAAYCFPTLLRWWGSEAADWLDDFARQDPNDRTLRVAQARYRIAQGRLDAAARLLDDLLAEFPEDRNALAARLTMLEERSDEQQFLEVSGNLPPEQPDEPWALRYWRGRLARERGDGPEAERRLLALVADVPAHLEAWRELLEAAKLTGHTELRDFAAGRVRDLGGISNRLGWAVLRPGELRGWVEIAQICAEAGLEEQARLMIEQARSVNPRDPLVRAFHDNTIRHRPVPRPSSAVATSGKPTWRGPRAALSASRSPLKFREATAEVGVKFQRFDDISDLRRIHEVTGGGVALLDMDGDGGLDLFFTNGCRLPRRLKSREHVNTLWRQRADGTFQSVAPLAGVDEAGYFGGIEVADWDADGFPDLCVTGYRVFSLWRNQGDGTFERLRPGSERIARLWSTSAAFLDATGNGDLDLFVATYVLAEDDPPRLCPEPSSPTKTLSCPPTLFPAEEDVFLANDGAGGFRDATTEANLAGRDGKGLGVVAFDHDGDGRMDLYVANDGTPCFLYRNLGAGPDSSGPRFEEIGPLAGVAVDGSGLATAAMGVSVGDYDRDGWNDLTKTNFYLEPITLYHNEAGAGFADASAESGVGPPSRQTLGFGVEFFDADNDGWLDLFVANGHIEDRDWTGTEPYRMVPHLFRNRGGGAFVDEASATGGYFAKKWIARGVAVGDLNRDGRQDLVVSHQLAPSVILLNETSTSSPAWELRFVGQGRSNRSALGTKVTVVGVQPPLFREVTGGGSFQSASSRAVHISGIGTDPARFDVTWPEGTRETLPPLPPGRYVVIAGRGAVRVP